MLKIFVGSSTAYHPHWGEGGKGANSIPQTTQLNFRKRFIYVRSTKISLFTSLSVKFTPFVQEYCLNLSILNDTKKFKKEIHFVSNLEPKTLLYFTKIEYAKWLIFPRKSPL